MNDPMAVEILAQMGAVLSNGHFVWPSGDHSSMYIDRERIYDQENSDSMKELYWRLADHLRSCKFEIETVVGAYKDGIILPYALAQQLMALAGNRSRVISVAIAEKAETKNLELREESRAFVRGKNVLIVKDVITTGATVRKLTRAVRDCGGHVVGVAALCNRGGLTASALGVPILVSLTELSVETYQESECPLCARGEPVRQDAGRGREYLERKRRASAMAR